MFTNQLKYAYLYFCESYFAVEEQLVYFFEINFQTF